MTQSPGKRLEAYTLKRPQEVLIVTAEIEGTEDQVLIYKGFSSSLRQGTAFDPDIPILPDTAQILTIDRIASPYTPDKPQYIEQGLTWEQMQPLFLQVGV
ncbi:hypothetical protein PN462_09125 [Spirulina sp. CS-785/01]|uniref:DUF7734 family protein n=1 Tax=Spirulina sp. CS-785/01 TaxID=3021716 RepID=UPI00232BA3A5|nr:hypothetical protein [Spirulina sp. CS-785/01]MDB9313258.1 hypothetical protein [Spirulina sp. CS-785/01]